MKNKPGTEGRPRADVNTSILLKLKKANRLQRTDRQTDRKTHRQTDKLGIKKLRP